MSILFFLRGRRHLASEISERGLWLDRIKKLDFSLFNNIIKIKWIQNYLKNPLSLWNIFPHFIFEKLGGLRFLLQCSYNVDRIPIKLATFHKQILTCWNLLYHHNFSPHKCYLWNNHHIAHKRKTIFLRNWFDNNIILVSQLIKANFI